MKKTKNIISLIMVATLMFGCGSENNAEEDKKTEVTKTDKASNGSEKAQPDSETDANGNASPETDTQSDAGKDKDESSPNDGAQSEETNDLFDYFLGVYSNSGTWHMGGTVLKVEKEQNELKINYSYYQAAPQSRVAEVSEIIDITNMNSMNVKFDFTDSFGNKGTMLLEFIDGNAGVCVRCTISDLVSDMTAVWGVYDGEYLLFMDEGDAYARMEYTESDYSEWESLGYPAYNYMTGEYIITEPEVSVKETYYYNADNTYYDVDKVSVKPKYVYWNGDVLVAECFVINGYSYDVSNVDLQVFTLENTEGVIASASFGNLNGLTLEPHTYREWTFNFDGGVYNYNADLSKLNRWSSTVGCEKATPNYDMTKASGILASLGVTEEEFKANCQRLLSKGVQLSATDGTEVWYGDIVEYPGKYVDKWFVIDNISQYSYDFECTYKGITTDGYPYYEDVDYYDYNALIYDFRDDPYSPNIVSGDDFTPYVIFKELRTINGEEWLVFWMITMDK